MKFNAKEHVDANEYCLKRSWRLRRDRKRSSWMIHNALEILEERHPSDLKYFLKKNTEREFGNKKLGNPIIVWMLLNILMPIVIKLVIKWWEKRNG